MYIFVLYLLLFINTFTDLFYTIYFIHYSVQFINIYIKTLLNILCLYLFYTCCMLYMIIYAVLAKHNLALFAIIFQWLFNYRFLAAITTEFLLIYLTHVQYYIHLFGVYYRALEFLLAEFKRTFKCLSLSVFVCNCFFLLLLTNFFNAIFAKVVPAPYYH